MSHLRINKHRGFILIFALWVLGFLTVLAVGLAAGIRQKIVLLEKLDERSRFVHLLEGAVKTSAVYIVGQLSESEWVYKPEIKMALHNNPSDFGQFNLEDDTAVISYVSSSQEEYFGVMDEERKINLNTTTQNVLERLIERVLNVRPEEASNLARDLLDWHQYGSSQVTGFFSDEYYRNLQYPYPQKDSSYETLDELLLVKGMTKERYEQLINYVTIYSEGKVNINTASDEVLYALGLEDSLIDKILEARRGKDGVEATLDDHVFLKPFDVAIETNAIVKLLPAEIRAIDALNKNNLITTSSYYFTINVKAQLAHKPFTKNVRAVFSARENKIACWQER